MLCGHRARRCSVWEDTPAHCPALRTLPTRTPCLPTCLPCPVLPRPPCLQTEEFHEQWRLKARDVLARTEWRKRKLVKRVRACPLLMGMIGSGVAELPTYLRPANPLPSLLKPSCLLSPAYKPNLPPNLPMPLLSACLPACLQIGEEEERAKSEYKEERAEAKKKAQTDKAWEKTRDERVGSWRDFVGKKTKKTKAGG